MFRPRRENSTAIKDWRNLAISIITCTPHLIVLVALGRLNQERWDGRIVQHAFRCQKGAEEFGSLPKIKRPLGKSSVDASVFLKWVLSKSCPRSPTV
jgi:hypothetical protein